MVATTRTRTSYNLHWPSVKAVFRLPSYPRGNYTVISSSAGYKQAGTYKIVKDVPGTRVERAKAPRESVPVAYTKGIDPGRALQRMEFDDLGIGTNDFKIATITGKLDRATKVFPPKALPNGYIAYPEGEFLALPIKNVLCENLAYNAEIPVPVASRAESVLAKALNRLGEADSDYGMFLAELRETASFMLSPVKACVKMLKKDRLLNTKWLIDRKGKIKLLDCPRGMRRILRHFETKMPTDSYDLMTSAWLSYHLAVVPMVNDLSMILDDALHGIGHTRGVFRKRARLVEKTTTWDGERDSGSSAMALTFKFRDVIAVTDTHRAQVYGHRIVLGGYWERLLEMGLDPFRLPALAWELIPMSFVVDRFVNIGDWLSSHRYNPNTNYLGNTVSRRYQVVLTRKAHEVRLGNSVIDPETLGVYTWSWDSYSRTKWTTPVTPVYNHRELSMPQIFDHLSLIWQYLPQFVRR